MFELVLRVPEEGVELISDALEELDALSVSIEDADAQTSAEQAMFGEPGMPAPKAGWARSTVVAHFASETVAAEALELLSAQDFFDGTEVVGVRPVPDQDWVRLTQSQFDPVEITPCFWIVPTWHEPPASAERFLRLDPGLAFGSGTHPTTRMCLRWIATHELLHQRVLDYGCGSGILAMAAKLHGAGETVAVDIDPAAVTSTADNAAANHVTLHTGLPDVASGVFGVVLANILATPLKVLAPLLCGHLAPGGRLVLAGILSRQADELTAAYAPYLALSVADEQEGWVLMTATAHHAPATTARA
jgi:ribosomal protein L11 methyltransferase